MNTRLTALLLSFGLLVIVFAAGFAGFRIRGHLDAARVRAPSVENAIRGAGGRQAELHIDARNAGLIGGRQPGQSETVEAMPAGWIRGQAGRCGRRWR